MAEAVFQVSFLRQFLCQLYLVIVHQGLVDHDDVGLALAQNVQAGSRASVRNDQGGFGNLRDQGRGKGKVRERQQTYEDREKRDISRFISSVMVTPDWVRFGHMQ